MSARRCSKFVAMYMIIAMANAAIAGTVMTIRNLRSIGRSANQRVNRPPFTAQNELQPHPQMSAWRQKSAVSERDKVHVVPTNGRPPKGMGALGFGAGGGRRRAHPRPIECRAGIGFAPWRNVAVSYQAIRRQARIGLT